MSKKQGKFVKKTLAVMIATGMLTSYAVIASAVDPDYDTFGVVGTFNDWSSDVIMTDEDGDGIFTAELTLDAGSYEWKVRTNGEWYDSWGAMDENGLTYNSQINLRLEVNKRAKCEFSINTNDFDELVWQCDAVVIEEFTYEILEDGNIAITGYNGTDTDIVIPSEINGKTVTQIGYSAFWDCDSLTSVVIPESVTQIGDNAFQNCNSLTSVNIPNSVTQIGNCAFSDCDSLTSINVSEDNAEYTSEDGVLFNKDKSILICYPIGKTEKTYTIPNSVTQICDSAFSGCNSLTSVVIPNGVTQIGDYAFCGCDSLTSVVIPNSVTEIGVQVFMGCSSLTNVNIPDNVTRIGIAAFMGCSSLTDVNIPNSVTQIEANAFCGCSNITSIVIPDGITQIDHSTFEDCINLTNVVIPNTVIEIKGNAFRGCSNLTSIVIPNSVTEIGSNAFMGCTSLKSIVIQEGGSTLHFNYLVFASCTSLTSIVIPNSVTKITMGTFGGCSNLTSIIIPNSVTKIDSVAFLNCERLKSIVIPDSVTEIVDDAFYGCEVLTIYGNAGSYAETYASNHSIPFVVLTVKTLTSKVGDISASGTFVDNMTLSVEKATVKNAVAAYDITLKDESGTTVQPSGAITVSIPSDNANCKVYYIAEDGTMVDMNATYADGKYEFTTDHLSVYALVEKTSASETSKDTPETSKDNPSTGDNAMPLLFATVMAVLGGITAIFTSKNRKVRK